MNEIVLELISQFGISGLILALVGYIAWDRYKVNQRKRDGVDGASKNGRAIEKMSGHIDTLNAGQKRLDEKLDTIQIKAAEERTELRQRIDTIESTLDEIKNPDHETLEAQRLEMMMNKYPLVHNILDKQFDNINCDHIAVAHLHNGTKGLTGIPFIKFSVVAERYNPGEHPTDNEMASKYNNEDMMRHNNLPATVIQAGYIKFDIYPGCPLQTIDRILYDQCTKAGIEEVAFNVINNHNHKALGYLFCYSFTKGKMIEEEIKDTKDLLESVYNS